MELVEYQAKFKSFLTQWCASKRESLSKHAFPESVQSLIHHGLDLIASEGKRVRPYIARLAYEYHGGNSEISILQLGLVLELLHVFALIHDDWMDRGRVRRDVTTAHIFMEHVFEEQKRLGDLVHCAASQAVLLGDLVFGWVYQELDKLAPDAALRNCFQKMIDEVIFGQMLDVDSTTCDVASTKSIHQKMLFKTASYTFIYPLQLGALLAGDNTLESVYYSLGSALGIAYQMQDDLLDIISDSTGKTPFSDITNHQHSICTQYIFDHGTVVQKDFLRSQWGKMNFSSDEKTALRNMFSDSGAIAYAQQEMNQAFEQASQLVRTHWQRTSSAQSLEKLIAMLINRMPS